MEPMVEAGRLERFLDLRPKVIVAACDPLAIGSLDDSDDPLFEVWQFTSDGGVGAIRPLADSAENTSKLIALPNPPTATCVLAAQTTAGRAALEVLRTWWIVNSPQSVAPVLCCRAEEAVAEILRVLLRAVHQELRDTVAQLTSTTAQMYELRCEHEQ